MEMEQEIKEIIKKNLPAHVGDVLKQRLDEAAIDKTRVTTLTKQLEERDQTIKDQKDLLEAYKKFDERNAALEAREKALDLQERDFKVKTLEYQLESEKEKSEFTKGVALGLVRNTNYRKTIFDSEEQSGYCGPNGNWVYPTPVARSFTENKIEE